MASNKMDYSVGIIITIILSVGVAIVMVLVTRGHDPLTSGVLTTENCSLFTCPAGEQGIQGLSIPGRTGETGMKGDTGFDGQNGRNGVDGICLANPLCEKGETGSEGIKGDTGAPGIGVKGDKGNKGDDGADGTNGIDGANSTIPGPTGDNGVCDCFNISTISFDTVAVNTSLSLVGNMSCAPGAFIDSSCNNVAMCPNFATCDLQAASLTIKGGNNPISYLHVGEYGNQIAGEVIMGDAALPLPQQHMLARFKTYAYETELMGLSSVKIQAVSGILNLIAGGSAAVTAYLTSEGFIRQSSKRDFTIDSEEQYRVFASGIARIRSSTALHLSAPGVNVTADSVTFFKSSTPSAYWLKTNPYGSYGVNFSLPLTVNSAQSIEVAEDIIMHPYKNILSLTPNGFQTIGPNLKVPGGRITTLLPEHPLSLERKITNSVPGESVVFEDTDGIELRGGTNIFSVDSDITISVSNLHKVHTFDTNNVFENGQTSFYGMTFSAGGLNLGNLPLTGVNTINGNSVGGSACCTAVSDKNLKRNVKKTNKQRSFKLVMDTDPVDFSYIDNLLKTDKTITNTTKTGFIAQDILKLSPNSIQIKDREINGVVMKDVHSIKINDFSLEMIAHLVNTIKVLNERIESLENKFLLI